MKRRNFLQAGAIAALTGGMISPTLLAGCNNQTDTKRRSGQAKNIIFLVSDGMSIGTPVMADLLLMRKENRASLWMDLYRKNEARRAFMDTSSADSIVTDSAAGSSSWGGGKKVNNGTLNVNSDGSFNKPILQKFKEAGKSVGCVTTVPITHATPAGFCVNNKSRSRQDEIASDYLKLKFDVMMGGGQEYFDGKKRADKKDIFSDFTADGFQVVRVKEDMEKVTPGKPLLGVFSEDGLPYSVDMQSEPELAAKIPTLAEMTRKAISQMEGNSEGFVLQVEGGKVDWAAHANDASALIYDQIAFDEAVTVAIDFARGRNDTLVVITTDHGNSNPGLIKSHGVDAKFDLMQGAKYSNEWVLQGIRKTDTPSHLIERLNFAQGITVSKEEAKTILQHYESLENDGLYNDYKLPYKELAIIQQNYTSIGWSGMDHSADYVELAMFGAGSEALPMFVKNSDLHNFMLEAAGMPESVWVS